MNKSIGYITGEEFMELAAVQGAKVLSAPKSLHRRIGKVNILEVPDIEKYVEEDEIIISTLSDCFASLQNEISQDLRLSQDGLFRRFRRRSLRLPGNWICF